MQNANPAKTLLFSLLAVSVACGEDVRELDLRNRTGEASQFAVIFCARSSEGSGFGHAFVVWAEASEARQLSAARAFGFYPTRGKKGIFGDVQGELINEAMKPASNKPEMLTHRLVVLVNRDKYLASQSAIDHWRTRDYNLFYQNCLNFAHEAAAKLDLIVPPPKPGELPMLYLPRLIKAASFSH